MTIPKEWRRATVTAISKKGNNSMPGNYRPGSLTSVVCKTMKKIVRDHLTSHMRQNYLFSKKQFIRGIRQIDRGSRFRGKSRLYMQIWTSRKHLTQCHTRE